MARQDSSQRFVQAFSRHYANTTPFKVGDQVTVGSVGLGFDELFSVVRLYIGFKGSDGKEQLLCYDSVEYDPGIDSGTELMERVVAQTGMLKERATELLKKAGLWD